jgi:phosphoesterase RecJ-like protein
MPVDWPALTQWIQAHQNFLITSHIRPDCDALGSELGLVGILESLGKKCVIVNGQGTPPNLAFIDPERRIRTLHEDVSPEELADHDALVILDTSAWAQLGAMGDVIRSSPASKIIIDHHVSEDELGARAFKDTTAEATGRLVVELADQLGVPLTPTTATPLFCAIATDTGWFRFGSTTSQTYAVAARLVGDGAIPARIYGDLYEQETLGRLRLRGLILSRLETERSGRLVHTFVRQADYQAAGAVPTDTEDAINLALAISGTEVAVILVEQVSGGFKISFRSRGALDCSQVAQEFGGGGHKAAAGAFIEDSFDNARQAVLKCVRQAMSA